MEGAREMPLIHVRVPEELRDWIKQEAVQNRRSMNGEMVARLEESRRSQQRTEVVA